MKRALFLAIVIAGLLNAVVPAETTQPDALQFFKNYFVTGDYVVGGVGLRGMGVNGIATGYIEIGVNDKPGVPEGVDILAAFLYWQAVTKDATGDAGAVGVTFGPWTQSVPTSKGTGIPLSVTGKPFGKVLGTGTPPCWSSGGGTGGGGGAYKTYTYRTDVLRFLKLDEDTGKYRVNGWYQVQLPDGDGVTALGASLVVIYRDPAMPLKAIVLYDGAYTMDQSTQGMSQSIKWFYDGTASAKLTHIVGSGQNNKSEILWFNKELPGETVIEVNPFWSSAGPNWDNRTFTIDANKKPLPGLPTEVRTSVDHQGLGTFDCLTWAAIIYATPVNDDDFDGLLNAWESSPPPTDPYGVQLPDLAAMGATPDHKDVFIEVGYMYADGDPRTEELDGTVSYGGVPKPAHSHMPTPAAIKLMGDAFKNAPVDCIGEVCKGIRLHIDPGPDYEYPFCTPAERAAGNCIIVPGTLARGGEALNETATQCTRLEGDPVWVCQYPDYPGTVGWKTGFRYIRDEVLAGPPPPADPSLEDDPCEAPGNTCVRRFDANRHDMFHYVWFAHSVGMPKSTKPCLEGSVPANDVNGLCQAPITDNPDFHIPRTNSGVADFPGGDVLVTLGAFSDREGKPGGTDFMVASTVMHELGHNLELRHGAWQATAESPVAPAPNCIPTYLSVMNYLYQLRGLLDDAGVPHVDFARDVGIHPTDATSEQNVSDGPLAFTPLYRIGWYTPLAGSYLEDPITHLPRTTVAGRHCDGSDILATDQPMVRVDAATVAGSIDWNADGDLLDSLYQQDVNFNGRIVQFPGAAPELPPSFDDWANVHLNQLGARRNVGARFMDEQGRNAFGPLSIGLAAWDLGRWEAGRWEAGRWEAGRWEAGLSQGDLNQGDNGRWEAGRWEAGRWEAGRGDDGRGDGGGGDYFVGDPNNPGGCLDHETATLLANTPPYGFACVLEGFSIHCEWMATNEGNEIEYALYRVTGTALTADQEWVPVMTVTADGSSEYAVTFEDTLDKGVSYLYFATAVYQSEGTSTGEVESSPSDTAQIVGPNHAPVAINDSYSVPMGGVLTIAKPGVLANDTDTDGDGLTAVPMSGPSRGTLLLNADGSFTYTPDAGYTGDDSFTYKANDGTADSNIATVTIAVKVYTLYGIQNVPPAASTVKAKAGSSVPMEWQFKDGSVVVNSSGVHHQVTVVGTNVSYTISDTDPGSSSFRYDITTNTWYFNLQTKKPSGEPYPIGEYQVTITPTTPGYRASPSFKLTLTK